jgi:hypothetical protein
MTVTDGGGGNRLFRADREKGNTKKKHSRYLDSNATSHVTSDKSLFFELHESEYTVFLADDTGRAAKGMRNGELLCITAGKGKAVPVLN